MWLSLILYTLEKNLTGENLFFYFFQLNSYSRMNFSSRKFYNISSSDEDQKLGEANDDIIIRVIGNSSDSEMASKDDNKDDGLYTLEKNLTGENLYLFFYFFQLNSYGSVIVMIHINVINVIKLFHSIVV